MFGSQLEAFITTFIIAYEKSFLPFMVAVGGTVEVALLKLMSLIAPAGMWLCTNGMFITPIMHEAYSGPTPCW